MPNTKTVAIIGGGPAGAALGLLLARKRHKVAIFHTDKRPPLIVGESLIPAIVPMLRILGIEEEVKSFSIFKPGATVCLSKHEVISAGFSILGRQSSVYSYNTPRDQFDLAVLNAAEKAGAKVFRFPAKLEKGDEPDTVRLTQETLDKTGGFLREKPDLIVDAAGRLRLISKLLDAPAITGQRNDIALFAHLDTARLEEPANSHIDFLSKGWAWRIPLPGKVSLGFVINPAHLEKYGGSIEQQYDSYLRDEPTLKMFTEGATRVTPVVRYNNFQLISQRMHGPGWAMVGDSAGFLDPVFSTGLYLSLKGAFELFKAIQSDSDRAMQRYEDGRHRELNRWRALVDNWYSGKMFNLYRAGFKYKDGPFGKHIFNRVQKRLIGIFTGQQINDPFSMRVFGWLTLLGSAMRSPKDLEIV